MERYHIFKLGLAIIFYAMYCIRPMMVYGVRAESTKNQTNVIEDEYVYYQGVEGKPGVDFPVLSHIPRTSFTCKNVDSGYYADLETDCQVFHICEENKKISFLCPNGTIFQQNELICEWWFKVNCTTSPLLYAESAEQLHENTARRKEHRKVSLQKNQEASRRMYKENSINQSTMENNNLNNHAPTYRNIKEQITRKPRPLSRNRSIKTQQVNPNEIQAIDKIKPFTNRNRQNYVYKSREEVSTKQSTRTTSFIEDFDKVETESTILEQEVTTVLPIIEISTESIQALSLSRNDLSNNSDETQIPEETASFYKNFRNKIEQNYKPNLQNVHSNHRDTYSDLKEPKYYSKKIISTLSSVTPQYLTTQPLNNGKPFLGSQVGTTYIHSSITTPPPRSQELFSLVFNKSLQYTTPEYVNTFTKNNVNFITPPPIGSLNVGRTSQSVAEPTSTLPLMHIDPTTTSLLSTTNHAIVYGKFIKAVPTVATTPKSNYQTRKLITLRKSLYGGENTEKNKVASEILSTSDSVHGVVPRVRFFGSVYKSIEKNQDSVKNDQTTLKSTIKPKIQQTENQQTTSVSPSIIVSTTLNNSLIQNVNRPRPFQLTPKNNTTTTEFTTSTTLKPTYPTYKISSASPFELFVDVTSTEPTPTLAISKNVDSMINALAKMATQTNFLSGSRPGLVIPPSASSQTLHTLAQYFANALDQISTDKNYDEKKEIEKEVLTEHELEKKRLTALLTKMTINRYNELFIEDKTEATSTIFDLELQDTKALPTPKVRQLAKVFTQALSSYLDNPVTFKQVLEEVRPTEPPFLETEEFSEADDELLNFSDADIKSSHLPFVPTPPSQPRPTWGYLIAYNQDIKNSISVETENLQGSDSQSLVLQLNKLQQSAKESTTKSSLQISDNHWTTSPNANALWTKTFSFNPASINDNFGTTEPLPFSTYSTEDANLLEQPQLKENIQEIKYELRALPQLAVNSSQLQGILIDFMNTTKTEKDNRLQRILRNLNTTEDEFISKMREIEANPLTKRLILLLISECGTNAKKNIEAEAIPLHSVLNNRQQESLETASSINGFRSSSKLEKVVDSSLDNSNEDARALQLLNSLYTIASKFGK